MKHPASSFRFPSFKAATDAYHREFILHKLAEFDGNVTKAAEEMGVDRSHLYRRMKNLGIQKQSDPGVNEKKAAVDFAAVQTPDRSSLLRRFSPLTPFRRSFAYREIHVFASGLRPSDRGRGNSR